MSIKSRLDLVSRRCDCIQLPFLLLKCTPLRRQRRDMAISLRGERGTITVLVEDAMLLQTAYSKTFSPSPVDQTFSQALPSGNYNLVVARSSEWKGAYTVVFDCK